ncbi:tripeptidyl-peptidase II Tpp2 [Gonapodya sp. JEL0774]|nr:tripeptidyl-peptidase II Tpp2 [Gonapodya sp. JEL0774]
MATISLFPVEGLLPKEETQAASFVRKNPNFDGRDTVIAILDTGVDPAAPGLKFTSHGQPKVLDVVDCTGSGDVVMGPPVTPTAGGPPTLFSAATGRTLLLDPAWVIDGAKFRLGCKSSSELFPKSLVERMKNSRKKKWEVGQSNLLASAMGEADAFAKGGNTTINSKDTSPEDKDKWKQELKARVDALKDMAKAYEDPGDVYDVLLVSPPTGHSFVLVDTSLTGDLRLAKPLPDYLVSQAWDKFGDLDLLTYSIKIYDGGARVSIVTLAGDHGTHVASIASTYHASNLATSGVAPGARIVSLKIGDNRLGSMETGIALSRAATYLAQTHPFGKVHVSNMSYGEGASSVKGSFGDRITDWVVNRTGGVFVSSAGNAGPGIGTVGSPGGMASGIIGVGAYVTTSLQNSSHSMLEPVPERPYTWSSRGPAFDGWKGVSIYAPGGAVAEVPRYDLAPTRLGLLASSLPYTPYTIRRALENTAKDVSDPQGVGFVQVESAWDWLVESRKNNDGGKWDVDYEVTFPEQPLTPRGIYLRDSVSTSRVLQTTCSVMPKFFKEEDGDQERKLALEVQLELSSSAPWIQAPKNVILNHGGKAFGVKIDPTSLPPGLHTGYVLAHDTTARDLGALFRVPVTVCKPQPVTAENRLRWDILSFGPGHLERRFVEAPSGSNFAVLTVKSVGRDTTARFTVQIIQVLPQTRYAKTEQDYVVALSSTPSDSPSDLQTVRKVFRVVPGVVMEVCLAQFWSSLGASTVSVELEFHGIHITGSPASPGTSAGSVGGVGWGAGGGLFFNGGDGVGRMEAFAPLRKETFTPAVAFDILRRTLRPTDSQITPLASRDVLPDGRQASALTLTYEFKISESTTVTPRLPIITDMLYENPFEGFLLLIFDSGKKAVCTQDIYPKAQKLDKGEYTIRCQLVSKSADILERHSSASLLLDSKLAKEVSLPLYTNAQDAIYGGKSGFGSRVLQQGERRALFWTAPDVPKDVIAGDVLVGELKCWGGDSTGTGNGKVDGGLASVLYLVPPRGKENDNGTKAGPKDKKLDENVVLTEQIRDLEIASLKKLTEDKSAEILTRLESQYPEHLPLLQAKLDILSKKSSDSPSIQKLTTVIEQCNKLIEAANGRTKTGHNELALFYAGKPDTSNSAAKELKKEMDKRKDVMVSALLTRVQSYSELVDLVRSAPSGANVGEALQLDETLDAFEKAFAEHLKWAAAGGNSDATPEKDANILKLFVKKERSCGRFGTALKAINKFLNDAPVGDLTRSGNTSSGTLAQIHELKIEVLKELEWEVWVEYEKVWRGIRWPSDFALVN